MSCISKDTTSKPKPNFSLESASNTVSLFGEGFISTAMYERDIAITPDGKELIYTLGDYKQTHRSLVLLKKAENGWSEPEIIPFSGTFQDIEPFYADGGNTLYFASNRPIYNDSTRHDYNIWFSNRIEGGWSQPQALDTLINTRGDEFFPALSKNGNLYFTATKKEGVGREDIYVSIFENNNFQKPVPLPTTINSATYEFNAYISPNEDMLIFSSYGREDDMGGGDLYLSKKDKKGNWSPAQNLGTFINSDKLDYCPFIDWSNNVFYFTSEKGLQEEVTIKKTEDLIKLANSSLNGYGNIYHVKLDSLPQFE